MNPGNGRTAEQLDLALDRSPCPGCGSTRHDGCGYDPEAVKPAMSVAEALGATVQRAIEESGYDGARQRIPGLMFYRDDLPDHLRRRG